MNKKKTKETKLKVFTCNDHDCHYPVGVCSVVVAKDKRHGKRLLDKGLIAAGLRPFAECEYTLDVVDTTAPHANVILDGNY